MAKKMMGFKRCFDSSKAVLSMLLVQAFAPFIFAFLAYRHVVGVVCIAPFALYLERGSTAKLSLKVWIWLFFYAFTGISSMGLLYYGLRDTTATYATNFLNMIPIVTLVFSIILSVGGTILILVGMYCYLWGKMKELRMNSMPPVNNVVAMDAEAERLTNLQRSHQQK